MDGSRVAVQVLEDVVALPSSVVVEDSEVGSINEHLNQHSSQILSAFTDVAPEMFCAWQNEVYGWQHPNIITMPLELLCHQAAADMTTVLLYFSDNNACDIFRDDFCRNILSNPDFIEACNNVYFWATECCSESAEIQGTLQLPTTTPMLAAICHNASGTAMPPFLLTNLCDIQVVITFILAAVERQQVQSTIRSNREIRQRQDEAYQESLAIDRERANQHEISEALDQLQEEPLENVDIVRVRIRGPQGRTVQRTFFTTDTTEVLFLAAFALLALPSQHFRLRGSVATSETTTCIIIENNGLSLSELLQGDTTLSVEMTDEE